MVSPAPETVLGKERAVSRNLLDITDEPYGHGSLFQAQFPYYCITAVSVSNAQYLLNSSSGSLQNPLARTF